MKFSKKYPIQENMAFRFVFSWGPVLLWMSIIFFFSSRHSISVSPEYIWNFIFFKSLHVIEYAILFILTTRAVYQSAGGRKFPSLYLNAYSLTVLYAITDEIHQYFVPSRTPQPRDVIIDAIGAGFVWIYLSTQLHKAPGVLKTWVKRLGMPL